MISNSYKEDYKNYNMGVVKGVFEDNIRNHGNPQNGLMRAWVKPVSAEEEKGQGVVEGLIWKKEKSGLMGRYLWVHTTYQVEERLYQSWVEEEEKNRREWQETMAATEMERFWRPLLEKDVSPEQAKSLLGDHFHSWFQVGAYFEDEWKQIEEYLLACVNSTECEEEEEMDRKVYRTKY